MRADRAGMGTMMRRIILSSLFLIAFAAPAFATCLSGATPAGTATLKDAAASPNTFTAPYTDDGSGNCLPNVKIIGTPTVTGAGGTFPVTGTFWQTTQPVSGTFWQTTQPVSLATAPTTPVTGTFWQTTQPVSGTVTANAGTNLNTSLLGTSANQTSQITQETASATGIGTPADAAWTSGSGSIIAVLKAAVGGINGAIAAGTNVIGGIFGSPNVTPTDCSLAITTGGTAQNILAASATLHGFQIENLDTSEPVWFSLTTTAAAATIGSYVLAANTATTFQGGGSYTTPLGFGVNHAVSVVAATSTHKISCTSW